MRLIGVYAGSDVTNLSVISVAQLTGHGVLLLVVKQIVRQTNGIAIFEQVFISYLNSSEIGLMRKKKNAM